MIEINILEFIPQELRQQAQNALVDFVSEQAKKFVSDGVADKLKQLRTDGAFRKQFDKGLDKALKRFAEEYYEKDEDIVDAIAQEKDLFKSPDVKQALMTMLKSPGSYLADEGDVVAQTFDSVLPGRKNRERVNKAMMYLLRCLVEELWHLPELQPVYSLQFQKITAEAMKQQVELQKVQLQALVGVNEGVRQALLQLTDAIGEKKLLMSGSATIATNERKFFHNLPNPDYGAFIGREQEISKIIEILRPYPHSQEHIVTIDGIGGIGKSMLALRIAYYYLENQRLLPEDERFGAIIWTSAKRDLLTADGIKLRPQNLKILSDLYPVIAACLEREDITRADSGEQLQLVRNALSKQRTLLIVDNLETVDDETVLTFLRELPAPTKSIVTTRERIDVAYPIRLLGMPLEDGIKLIEQEAKRKNVSLSKQDVLSLFNRTGGIPLAIVWSISQMGFGYEASYVLSRLGDQSGDIAKFCFDSVVNGIRNTSAYLLILALSLFTTDASRDALGYITELSALDQSDGLVKLEKLSLVNKTNGRFGLLPLTKEYIGKDLHVFPQKEILYQRYFSYYSEMLKSLSENEAIISAKGEKLLSERENILSLIKLCQAQDSILAIDLIILFAYFLHNFGYWGELIEQCTYGLEKIGYTDLRKRAVFLSLIGRVDIFKRQVEESQSHLREAMDIYKNLGDIESYIKATIYLAYPVRRTEGPEAAHDLLLNSLQFARANNMNLLAAKLLNMLANFEISQNDFETAKAKLLEAISLFEGVDQEKARGLTPAYRLLAKIEIKNKNYTEAEQLLQRSLKISEGTNFTLDLAYSHQGLGDLYQLLGQYQKSAEHFRSAYFFFERLGLTLDCDMIYSKLQEVQSISK